MYSWITVDTWSYRVCWFLADGK